MIGSLITQGNTSEVRGSINACGLNDTRILRDQGAITGQRQRRGEGSFKTGGRRADGHTRGERKSDEIQFICSVFHLVAKHAMLRHTTVPTIQLDSQPRKGTTVEPCCALVSPLGEGGGGKTRRRVCRSVYLQDWKSAVTPAV